MIKLYKNGAWLTEGQEPVSDETGLEQKFHLSKQEAKKKYNCLFHFEKITILLKIWIS